MQYNEGGRDLHTYAHTQNIEENETANKQISFEDTKHKIWKY